QQQAQRMHLKQQQLLAHRPYSASKKMLSSLNVLLQAMSPTTHFQVTLEAMEVLMQDTDKLVTERGRTHGRFEDHARVTQRLKGVIQDELVNRDRREQSQLSDKQREAIEMILHKIGRIVA